MKLRDLCGAAVTVLASATGAQAAESVDGAVPAGAVSASTPLVVTGKRPGSPTQPSLEAERQALMQTAGSVGFVRAEDFQQRFANNLRDVLKDTPGVFVESRYGKEIRLSVRGSGLARGYHLRGVELDQDAVPLNMADGSGDFYEIDPLALRTIEIYKGGNGLAFGSSTLGGAVNAVTATARTAQSPGVLRLDGGSFGTIRASGQASFVGDDLDGLAVVTAGRADGPRDHDRQKDLSVNANLGWRIADGIENRLYLTAITSRQQLPGSLTLDGALRDPTAAAPSSLAGDQARNQDFQRLADRLSVTTGASGQVDLDAWIYHKSLYHPIFQVIDQDGMTWGAQARWSGAGRLGGLQQQLVAGVRVVDGLNNAAQYVNLAGREGALTSNTDQKALNLEAFAEDRVSLTSTVTLVVGAKAVSDRRRLLNFTNPPAGDERTYKGINPKVGLLWQATSKIQLFTDLTRSRDIPDFTDLAQTQPSGAVGFVPLDAQRAWTGEVGARGEAGPLQVDLTLYRAELRGELVQFNIDPDVPAATFNADRTVHQGVEASAALSVARNLFGPTADDRLKLALLWDLNDFRFDHDAQYGDNHIAGAPQNLFRAELRYTRPKLGGLTNLYLTPQVDWVPKGAWADQANTLRAPGYATLGIEAGFTVSGRVQLFVEGRNLTSKRYISDLSTVRDARAVSTSIFYPGDPRSVFAGVRLSF